MKIRIKKLLVLVIIMILFCDIINIISTNETKVVLAENNTSVSQYQNLTLEELTEKNNILLLDIEGNKDNISTLLSEVTKLSKEADNIANEQEKLAYKYEDIPLDTDLKNKILIESEKYNVDPDIMIGIYSIESQFVVDVDNSESTARGLGQILEGTAEWAYKEIYGENAVYNHKYAYDPMINIELTTYLIGYYHNIYCDENYYKTIIAYRGEENETYYNTLIAYANSLKERRNDTLIN